MKYRELYKMELSGAYLFYGSEKLLIDNAVEYISKKYIPKGMETFNLAFFEGKALTEEKLIAFCETLPIMSDKRVIFVKDVTAFSENVTKDFGSFLDKIGDFCILVFLDSENSLNKTKSFYKYFSKRKRNVEFGKLDSREVLRFVEGYIVRKGYTITKTDLSYLVSKSSYNSKNIEMTLYDLKNELDKMLSLSVGEVVNKALIDESLTENTDSNIFNFLNALTNKDTEGALKEYRNLHLLNEPVQKILFMFIRQVRILISYIELKGSMYKDVEIMNEIGIKQYEYGKIAKVAHNFKVDFLYDFYKRLLIVDESLKTSSVMEDVLLETLIVEFTKK
ncbi:DNA polymerase III subunit delta [Anaerosphaera multitolerans]|uniref:DNA polymerase III subunit delta n=1 Tax=Anaerosphaera multitolerans TaxID=2487351 RepID=A0A437S904_9FIRM|nr:DNA polymerase III subunit delta [Anaerosphaera multitolerans]RVU55344.1 DNA polymerase III subunit delta [Anaerosphaera multitolerans]